MADFPFMPMWTDAYLADTTHLRTEEHGAYLLLLFAAWRSPTCSVPDNDDALSRITGLSLVKWQAIKPTVMAFWRMDKRRKIWVQKRLKIEREKAAEKKGKARDSAASRWNKTKNTHANAMRTQCSPYPYPQPEEKPVGFSERAGARKKPKGWIERKTVSQALNEMTSEIERHDDERQIEVGGGSLVEPVQLIPASRAG